MPTNSAVAFARDAQPAPLKGQVPERLRPTDLPLAEDARRAWHLITDDVQVMERVRRSPVGHVVYRLRRACERSCPLERLGVLIVWLARAGASEAKLRLLWIYVDTVIAACFAGSAHRCETDLDRAEMVASAREDAVTQERHLALIAGSETPELLERAAEADEEEATLQLERARLRRRRAAQLRAGLQSSRSVA